jgi:peptidoglycan/xylan/chitin deacetylase (PgdA/CDA1 family)
MRILWSSQDPLLVGPYAGGGGGAALPFEVPSGGGGAPAFATVFAGDAWPPGLPPIDRLVALPRIEDDCVGSRARAADVILWCETAEGSRLPVCGRGDDAIHWNVDPRAWLHDLLTERYVSEWTRPITSWVPYLNYSLLPQAMKGLLSRLQSPHSWNRSNPIEFPQLPFDDLVERIRRLCASLASGSLARVVDVWPERREAAFTVTHDVDSGWILDPPRRPLLRRIVEAETALGFRGAWYVVARQFDASRHSESAELIRAAGHEIGPHGWNHDSRLNYLSRRGQEARMERIRERLGHGSAGMRTPWYCRSPQLFEVLSRHFSYDSSVPNTSSFFSAASNSGSCTVFPYRPTQGLFELPMTLPPDTAAPVEAVYEILEPICERIVDCRGVVVVTLHPQPHQSAHRTGIDHYVAFLEKMAGRYRDRIWQATPAEIVDRYRSVLEPDRYEPRPRGAERPRHAS